MLNTLMQEDMINQSYKRLTADGLYDILSDTTITGKYFYNDTWFVYMANSLKDGTIQGKNDVGSTDEGRWKVNLDGSMSILWQGHWEDWTGFAYKVVDEIMFFDSTSHKYKTTYTLVENGKISIDILNT